MIVSQGVVDEAVRAKETLLEEMIQKQQVSQATMLDEIKRGLDQAMEGISNGAYFLSISSSFRFSFCPPSISYTSSNKSGYYFHSSVFLRHDC